MLRCYLMDPDTDVCQTEQPQISYSVDFIAEQSSAIGSLKTCWVGRVHDSSGCIQVGARVAIFG